MILLQKIKPSEFQQSTTSKQHTTATTTTILQHFSQQLPSNNNINNNSNNNDNNFNNNKQQQSPCIYQSSSATWKPSTKSRDCNKFSSLRSKRIEKLTPPPPPKICCPVLLQEYESRKAARPHTRPLSSSVDATATASASSVSRQRQQGTITVVDSPIPLNDTKQLAKSLLQLQQQQQPPPQQQQQQQQQQPKYAHIVKTVQFSPSSLTHCYTSNECIHTITPCLRSATENSPTNTSALNVSTSCATPQETMATEATSGKRSLHLWRPPSTSEFHRRQRCTWRLFCVQDWNSKVVPLKCIIA